MLGQGFPSAEGPATGGGEGRHYRRRRRPDTAEGPEGDTRTGPRGPIVWGPIFGCTVACKSNHDVENGGWSG